MTPIDLNKESEIKPEENTMTIDVDNLIENEKQLEKTKKRQLESSPTEKKNSLKVKTQKNLN